MAHHMHHMDYMLPKDVVDHGSVEDSIVVPTPWCFQDAADDHVGWLEEHQGLDKLPDFEPLLPVLSQSIWDDFDQNVNTDNHDTIRDGLMARSLFCHSNGEICSGPLTLNASDEDPLSSSSLTNINEETSMSSIAQQYPSNLTRRSSQESGSVLEDSDNIDQSMFMMMTMVTRGRGVKRKLPNDDSKEYRAAKRVRKPVVFPFAVLKPCDIQGDITLKDINQRIHMVSSSNSHPHVIGATKSRTTNSPSPFYGKYVLAITRIHTEGQGSITIMKTRN